MSHSTLGHSGTLSEHPLSGAALAKRRRATKFQSAGPDSSADMTMGAAMKSHTEYLSFHIPTRMGFLNITPTIEEIVRQSGVREGILLCNAMHITASVFINDDEPGLHEDYAKWLEQLAPFDASPVRYHHNRTGEAGIGKVK